MYRGISQQASKKEEVPSRHFLRCYFFVEHVLILKIVYKGQNLINAVSNNTTPTILIYLRPPSKIKYNDNKTRPNIILTILSTVPTFAFKVLNSFQLSF